LYNIFIKEVQATYPIPEITFWIKLSMVNIIFIWAVFNTGGTLICDFVDEIPTYPANKKS